MSSVAVLPFITADFWQSTSLWLEKLLISWITPHRIFRKGLHLKVSLLPASGKKSSMSDMQLMDKILQLKKENMLKYSFSWGIYLVYQLVEELSVWMFLWSDSFWNVFQDLKQAECSKLIRHHSDVFSFIALGQYQLHFLIHPSCLFSCSLHGVNSPQVFACYSVSMTVVCLRLNQLDG